MFIEHATGSSQEKLFFLSLFSFFEERQQQGMLTGGEGSVRLTSSLRLFCKKVKYSVSINSS
jgi:hypothetical protein